MKMEDTASSVRHVSVSSTDEFDLIDRATKSATIGLNQERAGDYQKAYKSYNKSLLCYAKG